MCGGAEGTDYIGIMGHCKNLAFTLNEIGTHTSLSRVS